MTDKPKTGRPAARRICVTLPPHQVAWAQSQPKASPAVAAAIQFYLDSVKVKRAGKAKGKRT